MEQHSHSGFDIQKVAENIQFFQVIRIEDDHLDYQACSVVGELYDQFIITKNFEAGNKKNTDIGLKSD
jgi:hypothetical protein